jgi:hypothetical protein
VAIISKSILTVDNGSLLYIDAFQPQKSLFY